MIRNYTLVLLIIHQFSLQLVSQVETDTVGNPFSAEIVLTGRSYSDSIVLRWAPSTPGAWSYLNRVGYTVEKSMLEEGREFGMSDFHSLTAQPVRPLPLEEWETVVNDGPDPELAAIAAQSLYGESFTPAGTGIFDAADEFMNRYSFSLLGADLSAATANALGLRLTDREVEEDRDYIYRVLPAVQGPNYRIDTAYLVMHNSIAEPVAAPVIGEVFEGEGNIRISWDRSLHETVYSAYHIERSEDGQSFRRLTRVPYLNPRSDNVVSRSEVFQYVDSVRVNYKPYYYRLTGITGFGETSPPSQPVRAMGRDRTPPPPPVNVEASQTGPGMVDITWEVPEETEDLDGFYIGRGDDLETNFQPIHSEKIPRDRRSFTDPNADILSGNYYVVAAVDTAGNGSISMVSYAAVIDSIPPPAPTGLQGEIDSAGLVTLTWDMGNEPDLAGYMVYFSNSPDHVFSTVNRAPHPDTLYVDTITVRTLTRRIYYRLKAVDTRWNYSGYSAILELTRPDLIPPTSPVFSEYKLTEAGLWIEWIPSSSNDVAGYELAIREDGQLSRTVHVGLRPGAERYSYTHRDLKTGSRYQYTVSTLDSSGLRSDPASPVQVRAVDFGRKEPVEDLAVHVDDGGRSVSLNWSTPESENISRFILYRGVEGASLASYKSLSPQENTFTDRMLRKGVRYNYSIKAVYRSGRQSPFSNIVSAGI